MCKTAAPRLEAVRVGVGLEPCAFWGSWCTLGQTHETSHVDGVGKQAKLCIYLKASLADSRQHSSPVVTMRTGAPSDGSRLKERTAPVVPSVLSVAAAHQMVPRAAVEYSFRS